MSREASARAPSIELLLRERSRAELLEFYSFWNGQAPAPRDTDALVEALVGRMTDEETVRKRVKFLSKKLVELVRFLLRDRSYTAKREAVMSSKLFNYMSPYEVEAAINALQQRGFVFPVQTRSGEAAIALPAELGRTLQGFLWEDDIPLEELFSMRAFLRRRTARQGEGADEAADRSASEACRPEAVARRIESLDDALRTVVSLAAEQAGGFLSRSLYERIGRKGPRWNRRRFKQALEENALGTVRHLSLGEYGINHFDDTLVLFEETLETYWQRFAAPVADGIEQFQTCGVDLVSDVSHFLAFVAHHRVRLTLSGEIYRTVAKKLASQLILTHKEGLERIDPFRYVFDFCVQRKLVEKRPDRTLRITVRGRRWEREDLGRKIQALMDYAFREPLVEGDAFHGPLLRQRLLDLLGTQMVGVPIDARVLPFAARNAYIASLESEHVRDEFQNRYQYTPASVMRDAQGLAQSLLVWMRDRLYLLGVIDVGLQGESLRAVRLSPLGARALGREVAPDVAGMGKPLIVNPDFEVLLYPDAGDTYDLVTLLDRFAVRSSSDAVYRYKLTSASVERAVAEGLDAAEFLRVLSENARGALPQNVVYSVKEWAQAVRFVRVEPKVLLRGRNREVMDRVVRGLGRRGLKAERLSPTVVAVPVGADLDQAREALEAEGVFIRGAEGEGAHPPRRESDPNEPDRKRPRGRAG